MTRTVGQGNWDDVKLLSEPFSVLVKRPIHTLPLFGGLIIIMCGKLISPHPLVLGSHSAGLHTVTMSSNMSNTTNMSTEFVINE